MVSIVFWAPVFRANIVIWIAYKQAQVGLLAKGRRYTFFIFVIHKLKWLYFQVQPFPDGIPQIRIWQVKIWRVLTAIFTNECLRLILIWYSKLVEKHRPFCLQFRPE